MSETDEQRRERLVGVMDQARWLKEPEETLDVFLDALEPEVADMVRYGLPAWWHPGYVVRKGKR